MTKTKQPWSPAILRAATTRTALLAWCPIFLPQSSQSSQRKKAVTTTFVEQGKNFLQTNDSGNLFLVGEGVKMAGEGNSVWDLFCGIGHFTLPLAAHFKKAHGVERFFPTLERPWANGQLATIANINWHRADLCREDQTHLKGLEKTDIILLDPLREGAVRH